jgi:ribonuclease HI
VLAELSEFLGIQTNNFAEYSGLLASLDFALANGHRRLRVISDSELMVKQIQGEVSGEEPWAAAALRAGEGRRSGSWRL